MHKSDLTQQKFFHPLHPIRVEHLLKTSINFLIALFKKSFGCVYALPGWILNRYDNEAEGKKNS